MGLRHGRCTPQSCTEVLLGRIELGLLQENLTDPVICGGRAGTIVADAFEQGQGFIEMAQARTRDALVQAPQRIRAVELRSVVIGARRLGEQPVRLVQHAELSVGLGSPRMRQGFLEFAFEQEPHFGIDPGEISGLNRRGDRSELLPEDEHDRGHANQNQGRPARQG